MEDTNIHIFSDSQSTLQKVENDYTKSKLTLETNVLLNRICSKNIVELCKVQAHNGITGNEQADKLAKEGSSKLPIGPEPLIGFTMNNILKDLRANLLAKQYNIIKKHKIAENHKSPLLSYLHKFGHNLTIGTKNNLRIFTQMISDQNHLANNHSKRDINVVPFCRHCPSTKETAEHFITACPAFSLQRMQNLGHAVTDMNELIKNHKPADIIKFINSTGRLNDDYVCYYID